MTMIFNGGEVRWPEPVYLRIGYGIPEAIRSPKEAHDYLLFRWPALRGEKYKSARSLCLAANDDPFSATRPGKFSSRPALKRTYWIKAI